MFWFKPRLNFLFLSTHERVELEKKTIFSNNFHRVDSLDTGLKLLEERHGAPWTGVQSITGLLRSMVCTYIFLPRLVLKTHYTPSYLPIHHANSHTDGRPWHTGLSTNEWRSWELNHQSADDCYTSMQSQGKHLTDKHRKAPDRTEVGSNKLHFTYVRFKTKCTFESNFIAPHFLLWLE